MVIELCVVQFWSEIILVISNHKYETMRMISDQIALHSVQLPLFNSLPTSKVAEYYFSFIFLHGEGSNSIFSSTLKIFSIQFTVLTFSSKDPIKAFSLTSFECHNKQVSSVIPDAQFYILSCKQNNDKLSPCLVVYDANNSVCH